MSAGESGPRGRAAELRGRRGECGGADRQIEGVRSGESRVLVLRGEPGVGKTALLEQDQRVGGFVAGIGDSSGRVSQLPCRR